MLFGRSAAGIASRCSPFRYLLGLALTSLALAACIPRPPLIVTPSDDAFSATALPAATPSALPLPTAQPPTSAGPCTNVSEFVADATIPDGTPIAPNVQFVKRWQVRNSGTCDWAVEYSLVLVSGSALGVPPEAPLFPARAGAEVEVQLTFTAPGEPGEYTSTWQMRDPQGQLFGDVLFTTIVVVPAS